MSKKVSQYRICWKSDITGIYGHGKIGFSSEIAEQICYRLNCGYPMIKHIPILIC